MPQKRYAVGYMDDCIFCKIVRKEIPADIVYEGPHTLAFLDVKPNAKGHTLVIPKKHAANIFDVDQETLAQTMETVRIIAPAVRDGVEAKGVHINSNHGREAGQIVDHIHFHIIPRHARSEFEFWGHRDIDPKEAKEVSEAIRNKLA